MPILDAQKLDAQAQQGKFFPIYLLYGEEVYLVESALQKLKEKILGDAVVEFNFDSFYGQNADLNRVRETVETLPMMASHRLVIVKEFQDIKEKEKEKLLPIVQNPVESTVLILVASKVDKRKKIFKTIGEKAAVVEFKRPYDNQVPAWIKYICHQYELSITEEATRVLQQLVGRNLMEINNEVKKLHQYLGERKKIELEDIVEVVSQVRMNTVFDLANAIGANDRVNAFLYLAHLLDHGQSEVGALALIARHIRLLLKVKQGVKKGLSSAKLSAEVGVPSFFIRDYSEQAKKWSEERLEQTIQVMSKTDQALKSSPLSSHIWLENFVVKTCSP